jgi:hypothetical protein
MRPPPRRATQRAHLQALRETGATGLEPATSGVTGRTSGFVPNRSKPRDPRWLLALRRFRRGRPAWLNGGDPERLGHEWGTCSCAETIDAGRGQIGC